MNLANIKSIVIGVGDRYATSGPAADGELSIDDIRLHPIRCISTDRPVGDLVPDCKIDYKDIDVISDDWLSENTGLVLWYKFDETSGNIVHDSSGRAYDGTISHSNLWNTHGKIDGCVNFRYYDNHVDVPIEVLSVLMIILFYTRTGKKE